MSERLKVLLIEHDSGFATTVGEMLGRARDISVDIRSAPDLMAGLSVLSSDRFDVAVLDVSVPDGAGLGNVSLLKAEAPGLSAGERFERATDLQMLEELVDQWRVSANRGMR